MADDLMIEDDFTNVENEPVNKRRTVAKEVMGQTIANMKRKTIRVILEESEEIPPIGLYVGVNGKGFLIKPGVEVDLPMEVIGVLNNAVQSSPIIDPENQQVTGWRERMRYPYRLVQNFADAA